MRIKHHISGLYKKILTPIGVLVFLVVGVVFVYGINTWDSGYRVYHNNTFVSVQGGNNGALTKRVKSTCTVGDSIFIPTSGYAEWDGPNGFLNKKPSCVTIGCKTNSECKGGEICQGYVAPIYTCQGTTSDINTACARSSLTGTFGSAKIAQDVCNVLTTNGPVRAKYGILATGSDFGHPGYIFGLQVGGGTSSWESNCYTERSNLCKQLTKYPDSGTFSFSMNPHIASYSLSTNQCGSQYSVVSNYVNSTYKNILSHIECTLPTPSAPVACSTITSPSVCSASVGCTSVTVPETIGTCVACDPNSWSAWSTCTATCGSGTQTRTNACGTVQSQACNTQACSFTNKLTSISISAERDCSWYFPSCPSGYTLVKEYCSNCGTNASCGALSNTRYSFCKKLNYTSALQGGTCLLDSPATFSHGNYGGPYSYSYQKGVLDVNGNCININETSKSISTNLNQDIINYTTLN